MTRDDDVAGVAVSVLAAMARGDVEGADAVMATVDPWALSGWLLGLVDRLGPAAFGGRDAYVGILTAWRPGQRLGDVGE